MTSGQHKEMDKGSSRVKRERLGVAYDICEAEDRSTEYMIQFMMDSANASMEEVIAFLEELE
jgi:predicted transcriptional regulator